MKKILYLTSHLYYSKRQANFQHLCAASIKNGNNASFCTVPNSISTLIREKHNKLARIKAVIFAIFPKNNNNLTVSSYATLAHRHPKYPHILNKVADFLFHYGYSRVFYKNYDVIVFDSCSALFLFEKLKEKFPDARFVYRVSDSMDYKNDADDLIPLEKNIISEFDFISTASEYITKRLKSFNPKINIKTHFHGINKNLYNDKYTNPYEAFDEQHIHFVFVGAGKLDYEFIDIASSVSDNFIFHIIGPLQKTVMRKNVIYYGEMKFVDTIPYIKYADVGLQTLTNVPHAEVFERTLKYTQYTYAKLPIIAPHYLKLTDPHVFNYEHNLSSIENALKKALDFDKNSIDTAWIKDWSEIESEIVQEQCKMGI